MTDYRFHHVAISVSDVARSMNFYKFFGFQLALQWRASDGSLTLAHLNHPSGVILEIICYATNDDTVISPAVGNDLDKIGVKHLALHVEGDLADVRQEMIDRQLGEVTEIQHGRTRFDLFFIRDPDGLWVELLKDNRDLDVRNPIYIEESPRFIPGE